MTAQVAVLITSYNRHQKTLECLNALADAFSGISFQVYLVDDKSTDGTSRVIREHHPQTVIIEGSGSLYWNGGMRLAWQTARTYGHNFYLWLNDDVALRKGSVAEMYALYGELERQNEGKVIVVGKTVDPLSGKKTYGGYVRATGLSKLRWKLATDGDLFCDTFNGNCVLFPARSVDDIGISSEHFVHGFGDVDYGLRAIEANYRIVELREPVATLPFNNDFHARQQTLTPENWRFILFHPKGWPIKEWLYMCRRHAGLLWPINFGMTYSKMLFRWISQSTKG